VHREAHGLVANDLIEVEPHLVDLFMGSELPNPAGAGVLADGSPDPGSRVVLFTEIANLAQAAQRLGDAVALKIVHAHDEIVRAALDNHGGREIRHTGEGIMASFTSASAALRCAQEIQNLAAAESYSINGYQPRVRVGIAAGEPVEHNDSLFGTSVTAARRICDAAPPGEVLVSAGVRELAAGKGFGFEFRGTANLKGLDEPLSLFSLRLSPEPLFAEPAPAPVKRRTWLLATRRFVNELRRRHVVIVGAVYAGVLFVLLQIAELTFEPLGLPPWAYTLVLVLGLFGFPLAIVLAWGFDVTDQGVQRTRPASDSQYRDQVAD
jgi:class 3 adenylate cyclase